MTCVIPLFCLAKDRWDFLKIPEGSHLRIKREPPLCGGSLRIESSALALVVGDTLGLGSAGLL